ncbi:hypothetical protein J6590_020564 [Homalodisca vitripennis]|nr:hypothetical protein J6590_020564 [Homalodisca vitripennis]
MPSTEESGHTAESAPSPSPPATHASPRHAPGLTAVTCSIHYKHHVTYARTVVAGGSALLLSHVQVE